MSLHSVFTAVPRLHLGPMAKKHMISCVKPPPYFPRRQLAFCAPSFFRLFSALSGSVARARSIPVSAFPSVYSITNGKGNQKYAGNGKQNQYAVILTHHIDMPFHTGKNIPYAHVNQIYHERAARYDGITAVDMEQREAGKNADGRDDNPWAQRRRHREWSRRFADSH